MKNLPEPLILIPLVLIPSGFAAADKKKQKVLGLGMTTLTISNEEVDDMIKIGKSFQNSALLIKGIGRRVKKKAK